MGHGTRASWSLASIQQGAERHGKNRGFGSRPELTTAQPRCLLAILNTRSLSFLICKTEATASPFRAGIVCMEGSAPLSGDSSPVFDVNDTSCSCAKWQPRPSACSKCSITVTPSYCQWCYCVSQNSKGVNTSLSHDEIQKLFPDVIMVHCHEPFEREFEQLEILLAETREGMPGRGKSMSEKRKTKRCV